MGELFSNYWWVIFLVAVVLIGVGFSSRKRKQASGVQISTNYIEGLKAMIEGDDTSAFVKLKQAVSEDSDNVDAYLRLGDLLRKRGQHQKAVQIHRQLLLRKSLDSQTTALIWKSLAVDFISAKRFHLATEILEKLAKESAHRKWAKEKMLEVFEKTGQWEKAYELGREIFRSPEEQKRLAIYRQLAGDDLFKSGEYHKARLAYKDALHFDEKFAPAYVMIARSYLQEGRKAEAAECFRKLAENVPSEAHQIFDKLEETLFELGQYSEVESIYKRMLAECPNDPDILRSYAKIAEKKGNISAAIEALDTVLTLYPGDPLASAHLAQIYLENGHRQKAVAVLQKLQSRKVFPRRSNICTACHNESDKLELVCPTCGRLGTYKRT